MEDVLNPVEQVHDNIFQYLKAEHFQRRAKQGEFCYRLRRRFTSGKEKYWFLGSEQYIALTFWTGNDSINKTPSIFLEIRFDGRIALFLTARDSPSKLTPFKEIADAIPGIQALDNNVWIKQYTQNHNGEYIKFLKDFILDDKVKLDFCIESSLQDNNDSNESSKNTNVYMDDELSEDFIRPISEAEFYEMFMNVVLRRNVTDNYFFDNRRAPLGTMPLVIKSLEVNNFKGINQLQLDGIPLDTKWIVLTGENGYGKSSVLQSIALGLCGNKDTRPNMMTAGAYIILEGKKSNENFINQIADFYIKDDRFSSKSDQVAAYGAARLNISGDSRSLNIENPVYNLLNSDGRLINIENELIESKAYSPDKFKILVDAFCKLIPDLQDIKIESQGNSKPSVRYIEQDYNKNPYNEVSFDQLASGFRNIIAVVGDIITRLSIHQEKLTSLTDLRGIVIIDEIELHLHPKYQKQLPKTLSEIFPNIQFIVSTHSPIPLLGMPKETIILKVSRSKEEGIMVERLDIDFSVLLPNTILTSPVFGFQDIIPESHDSNEAIRVENTYTELQENNERKKEIDEFLTDERKQEMLKLLKK